MHLRRITHGIHAIEGLKVGRGYLVEDHEGVALVDTSSPGCAEDILRAIESIGRRPDDLKTIVATHYHYDHTGNVAALRERTGASLVAHVEEAPYIDGRKPWGTGRKSMFDAVIQQPQHYTLDVNRELKDGDALPVAGGLRVLHAPGHTPGHVALYAAERRVLFAGDAFMNTGGLQLPPSASTHDMGQATTTLRRLAALDFDHALPGHGAPVLSRASEKLAEWVRRWLSEE